METYQLKSKLVENDRELLIRTRNDARAGAISSEVWVNGKLTESVAHPHLGEIGSEEVVSILKQIHGEKKKEIESMMEVFRSSLVDGHSEYLTHLGTAFFYKNYLLEARELFSKAIERDSECHQAFNYLGQTELAMGQTEKAVDMLRKAVRQRPAFADYRNLLGVAIHAQGDIDRATSELEKAIGLNLYYADAYFNLGLVLLDKAQQTDTDSLSEKVSKVVDCFKKALLIHPDYDSVMFEQAILAVSNSNFSKAFELFSRIRQSKREKLRREFTDFHMKFALDPKLISADTLQERIKFLEQQVKKNPTYVDFHADLSRCYLELSCKLWEKGVIQYGKTAELNLSLGKTEFCHEEAEKELMSIRASLDRMTEKG